MGLRGGARYNTLLRAALVVDGGSEDDVPELLEEIGVEPANVYRVMLERIR